jgi:hypothetical protein
MRHETQRNETLLYETLWNEAVPIETQRNETLLNETLRNEAVPNEAVRNEKAILGWPRHD